MGHQSHRPASSNNKCVGQFQGQRLTNKLQMPNRRAAALRTLELGLICLSDCQDTPIRHRTPQTG
jgi:hypothetical protein